MMRSYRFAFVIMLILTFPLFDAAYKFFLADTSGAITYLYAQEEAEKKKTKVKKVLEIDESILASHKHTIFQIQESVLMIYKQPLYNYTPVTKILRPPIIAS